MPKPIDISCDGRKEEDGTFTLVLTMKGFESEAHVRAVGEALEPRAQEALAIAVRAKARILTPH